MKFPTLAALLLITLSSCASDKGDMNRNNDNLEESEDEEEGLVANNKTNCLPLVGKFVAKDGSKAVIELATKAENGKTSYQFSANEDFAIADGKTTDVTIDGKKGTFKLSCDAESVEAEMTREGKITSTIKYTAPDVNLVKVEATGELANRNGIYAKEEVKEEIAPQPVEPTPAPPAQ